jgi:predicted SAM-dependent methyltransferase
MMLRDVAKARMSNGLRRALCTVFQELRIQRLHRASLRRARAFGPTAPLRLNLGSGFRPKHAAGWINIDLSDEADLQLDLREPLPFHDNSVAEIYSEHFLEHLSYPNLGDSTAWEIETPERPSEALAFLRECRRVLVPGGVLDLVVPDAESILIEYAARDIQPFPRYEWWGPRWCNTPLHCVNYVFRQGSEHKYAYDEETLTAVLHAAGWEGVTRRAFDPAVDAENHAIGSLCMKARKPAGVSAASGSGLAASPRSSAA